MNRGLSHVKKFPPHHQCKEQKHIEGIYQTNFYFLEDNKPTHIFILISHEPHNIRKRAE